MCDKCGKGFLRKNLFDDHVLKGTDMKKLFISTILLIRDCCRIVTGLLQDFSNNLAFHKVSKVDSCRCVNFLFLTSKVVGN